MPVVAMPDGTQVSFPDDMPKEQIRGLIASKFPEVGQQQVPPEKAPEDKSLYQQLRERGANIANLDQAVTEGQKIRPEAQYEKIGQFAGGINDTIGAALGKGYHALMTDKGEERINSDITKLLQTPAGQVGLEALQKGGEIWDTYKQANPRTADLLTATGNIIGAAAGLGAGGKIASKAPEVRMPEINLPKAKFTPAALTSDEVRGLASSKYKEAADKGGILKPEFTNKFIDEIQTIKPLTKKGKILAGDTELDNTVSRIEKFRDTPFTLDEAQEVDETLGDIVDKFVDRTTGKLSKEGQKIYEIQSRFRNMVEGADASMIEGGKEGFKALKDGRKLWSTSRKMADIERIIARAEMTDNPATSMKTGFRTLYNNPNRLRGYTAQERDLIKNAATSSAAADILRTTLASRLIPIIGGSTGGIGAGIAGQAASMAARGASNRVQLNKATNILKEIGKDVNKKE